MLLRQRQGSKVSLLCLSVESVCLSVCVSVCLIKSHPCPQICHESDHIGTAVLCQSARDYFESIPYSSVRPFRDACNTTVHIIKTEEMR